ncbi:hypothetical protein ACSBR2_000622 [Camellia fascicularis]
MTTNIDTHHPFELALVRPTFIFTKFNCTAAAHHHQSTTTIEEEDQQKAKTQFSIDTHPPFELTLAR